MRTPPANLLWAYSLRLYAAAGVAECCIRAQDRHGANVNLLLACCWRGQQGLALDEATVQAACAVIADWDTRVVRPLRARRRAACQNALRAGAECARLRAEELGAEREEQSILYDWFGTLAEGPAQAPPHAIAANLRCYAALLAMPPAALAPLLAAALVFARGTPLGRHR